MYSIRPTTIFKKDLKRIEKQGYNISLLTEVIRKLANGESLPEKNKDHIICWVNIQDAENVILHRIGY